MLAESYEFPHTQEKEAVNFTSGDPDDGLACLCAVLWKGYVKNSLVSEGKKLKVLLLGGT